MSRRYPALAFGKRFLLVGILLTGTARFVRADTFVSDSRVEPAACALIGGALCLAGVRLRRRRD